MLVVEIGCEHCLACHSDSLTF